MIVSRRLRITGRVQGVSYRAWTRAEATRLGLTGWVRNAPDGSVEAYVTGPLETVETLITACHGGPGAAAVSAVYVEKSALDRSADDFVIRPDRV